MSWSRKADDERDLLVYDLIFNCRRNHKHRGKSVFDCAREHLPKHITYAEDSGMVKALYRGLRLKRGQLRRKKVGRRPTRRDVKDAVETATIVIPVYEALEKGMSKNQAYRYAKRELDANDDWRWANCKPLTESGIRAVFEKFHRGLTHQNLIPPKSEPLQKT